MGIRLRVGAAANSSRQGTSECSQGCSPEVFEVKGTPGEQWGFIEDKATVQITHQDQ